MLPHDCLKAAPLWWGGHQPPHPPWQPPL
jgi:hypothetical protein